MCMSSPPGWVLPHIAWPLRGPSAWETGSPDDIVEVLPVEPDMSRSSSITQAEGNAIMDLSTHDSYAQSSRLDVQRHRLDDQRADYAAMADRLRRTRETRPGTGFAFVRQAIRRMMRSLGPRHLQGESLEAGPFNRPARP